MRSGLPPVQESRQKMRINRREEFVAPEIEDVLRSMDIPFAGNPAAERP